VGTNPISVSVADVNGDGKLDVVTANLDSDNISVLLNSSGVLTELNKSVSFAPNANFFDAELYAQGNYDKAQLTLQRQGVANVNDVFGASNPISFANGVISYSGTSIGTVTQSNGKLDLTFNSNAIQSAVTNTLRSLTYTNVGSGASEKITLDWTFSDGNTGSQGDGGVGTVTGTSVVNITDLTPPSITDFSPTSYATNVALNSDIVLTFSESIQRGTGNIVLKNSIGTVIATYDAASSPNLSITGNTLTINPSSDLAFSTRYIVELASGSVKDLSGNVYSGASGYEFTTTAPNSLPTGSVTITGKAEQNQTLIVSNSLADSDGLGVISNQWFSNDVAISGANQTTYTLTANDVGKAISVKASYVDGLNKFETVTSSKVTVSNVNDTPTGSVTIAGTPTQGQVLIASNTLADADGLGIISNQWFSNDVAISGANQTTYTLTANDVGKAISVKASYTDLQNTVESMTSGATALIIALQTAPPGNVSNKIVALVFLADSDMEYKVANSSTKIFGCAGDQTLSFDSGVFNVHPDANVEKLVFKESMSNYKFKQSGNSLDIYNSADILITNTGLQDDSNGTQLQFLEGIVETAFVPTATGLTITISNQTVSNQNPEAISIIGVAHIG